MPHLHGTHTKKLKGSLIITPTRVVLTRLILHQRTQPGKGKQQKNYPTSKKWPGKMGEDNFSDFTNQEWAMIAGKSTPPVPPVPPDFEWDTTYEAYTRHEHTQAVLVIFWKRVIKPFKRDLTHKEYVHLSNLFVQMFLNTHIEKETFTEKVEDFIKPFVTTMHVRSRCIYKRTVRKKHLHYLRGVYKTHAKQMPCLFEILCKHMGDKYKLITGGNISQG